MPANHDDDLSAQATIAQLTKENTALKIQLLTISRDLATMVAMLADGHIKHHNGLGE